MKMCRDLVLIKADKPREKTASGILVAEEWKTIPQTGEILAVGPLVKGVKVGDRVMFDRYGSIILENDERVCKESHLMGVFDEA